MTCWKCNTYFCWLCGRKLNSQTPYLHFRDPGSQCFNMLYHGLIPNEDDEEDDFLLPGIYDLDDNIPDFSDDDNYDDDGFLIEY